MLNYRHYFPITLNGSNESFVVRSLFKRGDDMSVKQSKKTYAVKADHNLLQKCAENRDLTKKSYRVLLYLLTKMDSRRYRDISQKDIADAINMDRTSVSLALKSLKEEGIIEQSEDSQEIAFIDLEEDNEDEYKDEYKSLFT
jgi:DNA-binding MarR family transcriptional regulator